jgi:YbbR domain-containing protein
MVVRMIPTEVRVTINAPNSRWQQLTENPDFVRAWIDLTDYEAGQHTVDVKAQIISVVPAQVIRVVPETVDVTLETLATSTFQVEPQVNGDPSLGYQRGDLSIEPQEVTISGPDTLVKRVKQVRAPIDISGATQNVRRNIAVQLVDENGNLVNGLAVTPQEVVVNQVVNLRQAYRNLVVKPVTEGQVAEGYWLTNISVTPPNVTVFSADPSLVNSLPPFVETEPLDLTGLNDDTDIRATLRLPEGVSLVSDQSVLVRIGIAALQGSVTATLTPEITGLPPELSAQVAPSTVDAILTGPLPVLRSLTPASIRMILNLSGLEPGTYQVTPVVDLLPAGVLVESMLPQGVQVIIGPALTPTATSSAVVTILPTPSPAPELTTTPPPTP